eukprot:gene21968-29025_t
MRQQESLTRMNEIKAAAVLQAPSIQQPTTTSYLQLESLTRMNEIKAAAVLQAPSSQQPTTTSAMQLESLTRMNEIKATAVLQAPSSQQPVTPSGMQLVKLAQQGQHGTSDKLTMRDMSGLLPGRWLNDEVINFYLTLIQVSKYIRSTSRKLTLIQERAGQANTALPDASSSGRPMDPTAVGASSSGRPMDPTAVGASSSGRPMDPSAVCPYTRHERKSSVHTPPSMHVFSSFFYTQLTGGGKQYK